MGGGRGPEVDLEGWCLRWLLLILGGPIGEVICGGRDLHVGMQFLHSDKLEGVYD